MKEKKEDKPRIIIILEGYDIKTIEENIKSIVKQISYFGIKFSGPIPLPTKKKIITVPISPHKHKKSQEQFIRETHRRLIKILEISQSDMEVLKKLKISNTVGISLKT